MVACDADFLGRSFIGMPPLLMSAFICATNIDGVTKTDAVAQMPMHVDYSHLRIELCDQDRSKQLAVHVCADLELGACCV